MAGEYLYYCYVCVWLNAVTNWRIQLVPRLFITVYLQLGCFSDNHWSATLNSVFQRTVQRTE